MTVNTAVNDTKTEKNKIGNVNVDFTPIIEYYLFQKRSGIRHVNMMEFMKERKEF